MRITAVSIDIQAMVWGLWGAMGSPTVLRESNRATEIEGIGKLTKERSRYVHLWIVVERLEEMLVGHLDIPHPVEQSVSPGVVDCKFHELSSHRHVCRTFDHIETVRNPFFVAFSHREGTVAEPRKHEPVDTSVTANKHENLTNNEPFCTNSL